MLTLVKVYHKRRLHLERNALPVFAIPSASSNVFSEVTVLHLEENALTAFHLDSPAALANLKVSAEMVFFRMMTFLDRVFWAFPPVTSFCGGSVCVCVCCSCVAAL